MTPKEKAIELVDKFTKVQACRELEWDNLVSCDMEDEDAKQCALICVKELIENDQLWYDDAGVENQSEWIKVKAEIEKL